MKTIHIFGLDGREIEVLRDRADICLRHAAMLYKQCKAASWAWD